MNDLEQTKPLDASKETVDLATGEAISIRVSPHGYFTVLFLSTFTAALLFYLEIDIAGFAVFAAAWILIPFFALSDRIEFDGRRLERTGLIPRVWSSFTGSRRRLKISDIEQVETQSVRALRRGGSVYYRYRTSIRGKGLNIVLASGSGDRYRTMLAVVLPKLDNTHLDTRSIELRDHLRDSKETLMKAEFSRIPSADVLVGAFSKVKNSLQQKTVTTDIEDDKADELRQLANELRVSGHLARALEAFRRAMLLKPRDGWLMFEFARCLHAFAGMSREPRLERRALAALRLSQRHGTGDGELLVRIAEWYFQIGEFKRAADLFQTVRDSVGESFRSALGLAELALREGKIAHVIHHFATANRLGSTAALRRWSKGEADYFARLNEDEEYMEMEISRVNLLDTVESSKKTALRIAFLAFPFAVIGILFDDNLIANIGWAVSTVCLLIWAGLIVTAKMLSQRIPYELVESDND
ncbi:MAG: tetratricopeptide repeat protein [Pyrinomonadaceae bacterium]